MSWSQEWGWAVAIAAVPVVVLVAFEVTQMLRRRRFEAAARRSKEPRRPSGSRSRRAG